EEIIVTRLEERAFFGELSLVVEYSVHSPTAYASDETVLIGLFKPDLLEILERSRVTGVKLVIRLAEVLGRRLKETTEKISQLKQEVRLLGEIQRIQSESAKNTATNS